MSTLRTILAATDLSPDAHRAALRAALLAREHASSLRILHVTRPDSAGTEQEVGRAPLDLEGRASDETRQALQSLIEELKTPDLDVQAEIRSGAVLGEILAAADGADLLVLGPRGLRPVHELILGTAAERLLNKSTRPMLVVKQDPASQYRRVLVPVDLSEHSQAALRFARVLAPAAEICVFYAVDSPATGILRNAGASERSIAEYQAEEGREAREQMSKLMAEASAQPLPVVHLVQSGDPRVRISATAVSYSADLIVMGKRGRSALAEYFVGGVTRYTLVRAHCDVAIVPESRPA
jgi:nucleotide-binding universal stress UspA family protein